MPRSEALNKSSKNISSPPIRPPAIMGPVMPVAQPSFAQNVKDGFSLGIGVSVARNIVDRMFGSPNISPPAQRKTTSCSEHIAKYDVCMFERQPYECKEIWDDVKKCLAEK